MLVEQQIIRLKYYFFGLSAAELKEGTSFHLSADSDINKVIEGITPLPSIGYAKHEDALARIDQFNVIKTYIMQGSLAAIEAKLITNLSLALDDSMDSIPELNAAVDIYKKLASFMEKVSKANGSNDLPMVIFKDLTGGN